MQDKDKEWLDTKVDSFYTEGVETPRDWLREALKASLHNTKRPLGMSDWAYHLALTLASFYPEIITEKYEYEDGSVEYDFDWKKFDTIVNRTIDALIGET